jgi:hypothetical protein
MIRLYASMPECYQTAWLVKHGQLLPHSMIKFNVYYRCYEFGGLLHEGGRKVLVTLQFL